MGSSTDPCYIQNRVIMNRVIKRLRCIKELKRYGRTDGRTDERENEILLIYVKLVLISDTYYILILLTPNATARKRNELTLGTSLDRVDSELVKHLIDWRESE